MGMDGVGIAGLGWLIIALDGISVGVLAGLDPFTIVLDGVCRAGLVLMALCWHVVHLTRWHFVVFVLAVDGVGARVGVLHLTPLAFMLAAGGIGVMCWCVVCLTC